MTGLLLVCSAIVLVALFIISVVSQRVRRASSLPPGIHDKAREQLISLAGDLEMPRHTLALGISDPQDLLYVRGVAPKLSRMFKKDRLRMARSWLQENRQLVDRLMRLHRLIARNNAELSVVMELRIIGNGLLLKALLFAADAFVLLLGPFHARRMAVILMSLFDELSNSLAGTIAALDAAKKASIRAEWARTA